MPLLQRGHLFNPVFNPELTLGYWMELLTEWSSEWSTWFVKNHTPFILTLPTDRHKKTGQARFPVVTRAWPLLFAEQR
jgi:hypothetical protein